MCCVRQIINTCCVWYWQNRWSRRFKNKSCTPTRICVRLLGHVLGVQLRIAFESRCLALCYGPLQREGRKEDRKQEGDRGDTFYSLNAKEKLHDLSGNFTNECSNRTISGHFLNCLTQMKTKMKTKAGVRQNILHLSPCKSSCARPPWINMQYFNLQYILYKYVL